MGREFVEEDVKPDHIEHRLEVLSKSDQTKHNWYQKGTEIICDGDSEHFKHSFRVPGSFVLRGRREDGSLVFENLITREFSFEVPR